MKKSIIVPVLAVVTAGAVALGASQVSAQSTDDGNTTIVERIAQRFNLNQEDVKAVFDEEREAHMAEMRQRNEERLNEAVAAGELTEEQKQMILNKQAELREEMETEMAAEMESFKDMTDEERVATKQAMRDEMESRHEELKAWAEANGIDMKYLMVMAKFHGGPGMKAMKVMRFDDEGATETEDVVFEAHTEVEAL